MTSTAAEQFGTTAQLTVVPPFGPGVIVNPDLTPGVTQLRVDWFVSQGVGGASPAQARVDVYNAAQTTRDALAGINRRVIDFTDEFDFLDGRLVTGEDLGGQTSVSTGSGFGVLRLAARYRGSPTSAQLFDGTLNFADSRRLRGTTWVTSTIGMDGVIQNTSAIADKFWGSDVSFVEVIDYLVRRVMVAELATPVLPGILASGFFAGGYDATNIFATDILDALTERTSTEWWWFNGAVYFGARGQPIPGDPLILSPRGDPGTRRIIDKPQRAKGNQIRVPVLLSPDIGPKTRIAVQSSKINGEYFVSQVEHRGSNRRGVSRTIATLTPIGVVDFL